MWEHRVATYNINGLWLWLSNLLRVIWGAVDHLVLMQHRENFKLAPIGKIGIKRDDCLSHCKSFFQYNCSDARSDSGRFVPRWISASREDSRSARWWECSRTLSRRASSKVCECSMIAAIELLTRESGNCCVKLGDGGGSYTGLTLSPLQNSGSILADWNPQT